MKGENVMKNYVLLTIVTALCWVSPSGFASLEDMPDMGAYNWNLGDDFSNISYSTNNWDTDLPPAITFGINADDEYGYLRGPYTLTHAFS